MSQSKRIARRVLASCFVALMATSVIAQDQRDDRSQFQQNQGQDQYRDQYDQRYQSGQDRYQDDRDQDSQSQRFNQDRNFDDQDRQNRNSNDRNQSQFNRDGSRQSQGNEPAGLGVTISEDGSQGVRVSRVFQGSPAQQAGIRTNDEILRVEGQQITSPDQLITVIRRQDPDSQVRIQVNRDGQTRTLVARLESRQEALNTGANQQNQQRFGDQFSDRGVYYDTPRGQDDLMEHIDGLQRQVERLRRELTELRSMVADDPSSRNDWNDRSSATSSSNNQNRFDSNDSFDDRQQSNRQQNR